MFFMRQSLKILNDFNTLTLKQIFWKTFLKKLEYRFLVESTGMEKASFPYKTAISEAMLRQVEWWVQNGPITKNGVLPVTTLFFWKFLFHSRNSYKELIWCTNDPNAHISTFCKRWVLFDDAFSLWVSLSLSLHPARFLVFGFNYLFIFC